MLAAPPLAERQRLVDWYRRNRARSAEIFALVDESAYYSRPIALRHPFAFYEGHLPAFSFLTLNERALHETPLDARLEKVFERGIDPGDSAAAARFERHDWPSKAEIVAFGHGCDERVVAALRNAALVDDRNPRLVRAQAAYTILEHEMMHHETLLYIIARLDESQKRKLPQEHRDTPPPVNEFREVPRGVATLGAVPGEIPFGWDNEFGRTRVEVDGFTLQRYPVTNGDYLAFVEAGASPPPFWERRDGTWCLRGQFERLPFAKSWPVYVSHREASAYAAWIGSRLPTEAEFHRAAFGTPAGDERAFPWGEDAPSPRFGNFGFARYDPEPVDAHPLGASAWDILDLIGNGWEWTSTVFGPFDGFEAMASYPQYSADFFDGKHFVMKGASPVTAVELIRRSFRNWFYDDYPHMYAKFRCIGS